MLKFDFSGKKALVTGAGQGIGRELVKALCRSNAAVIALSKSKENLDSLKKECPGVATIECDLADIQSIEALVRPHLPVDCLVNNAAIQVVESFLDVSEANFDKIMTVNLKAPLFLSQIVVKSMLKHNLAGSIVNISSQAAQLCIAKHTSYACSKSALDCLTRQMCSELSPMGIRVNSVLPTVVLTEMGRKSWSDPVVSAPMLDKIPLRKFAGDNDNNTSLLPTLSKGNIIEIDDVVSAALFLLSDAAAMITGVQLPVDGGATAI